jgi:prepilin-type N-terminal cleavage/methylation domain-containing protein
MGCAHKENQDGFTLVEISIVMIIIGLLIGGTFGGMKLIENMQVNKTVQDLKAIESAALTFKDTYGRLPGDIVNPAARLPNCTVAPCATGGNGNRRHDFTAWNEALTATMEKYTFWSHLQAVDLLSIGVKNTTAMEFGEGQPEAPISAGYRVVSYTNGAIFLTGEKNNEGSAIFISSTPAATLSGGPEFVVSCQSLGAVDRKIDDGITYNGNMKGWACSAGSTTNEQYLPANLGAGYYDLKGF